MKNDSFFAHSAFVDYIFLSE